MIVPISDVVFRCGRCRRPFTPDTPAPLCIGAQYPCDSSLAVVDRVAPDHGVQPPGPGADHPVPAGLIGVDPMSMTDEQVLADLRRRGGSPPSARTLRGRHGMRHERAVRLIAAYTGTGAVR